MEKIFILISFPFAKKIKKKMLNYYSYKQSYQLGLWMKSLVKNNNLNFACITISMNEENEF